MQGSAAAEVSEMDNFEFLIDFKPPQPVYVSKSKPQEKKRQSSSSEGEDLTNLLGQLGLNNSNNQRGTQ